MSKNEQSKKKFLKFLLLLSQKRYRLVHRLKTINTVVKEKLIL
jgi:hypothetical protein